MSAETCWKFWKTRHGRGSTIVTSQLPVGHWHDTIRDPTIADGGRLNV